MWCSALDKHCIEAWWDNLPMQVHLFWLGMGHVNYLAIATHCEFHIVVNRDLAEWNEGVFALLKQFLYGCQSVTASARS